MGPVQYFQLAELRSPPKKARSPSPPPTHDGSYTETFESEGKDSKNGSLKESPQSMSKSFLHFRSELMYCETLMYCI